MRHILCAAALLSILCTGTPVAGESQERFKPIEVVIDTRGLPMAAYQFELVYDRESTTIVGLEGGRGHWGEAPYYDPKGLLSGRVIIAGFTTRSAPPAGHVTVATVHLMVEGDPGYAPSARLTTAAGIDGDPIPAGIALVTTDREEYE